MTKILQTNNTLDEFKGILIMTFSIRSLAHILMGSKVDNLSDNMLIRHDNR